MLCYSKLYNTLPKTNNGWVNTEIKEIYKTARVTVKYRNDKFLYLNDLEKIGLISFSNKNDNLNMKVNFINENSEIVLKIKDFRELGYEYQNNIGDGGFIHCTECGRLVKKKSKFDRSSKYCCDCARNIQFNQKKIWDKQNK